MATTKEVSCINEVLRDAPTMHKTGLIRVNKSRDVRLEAVHHDLGEEFHQAVL